MTPIRDHGLVGDGHTAALVALDGRVDWWCAPRFDSPPVYDAILGGTRAAKLPLAHAPRAIAYVRDTNVLELRGGPRADALATLFMPYPREDESRIIALLHDGPRSRALSLAEDGSERAMPLDRATFLLEETVRAWRAWLALDDAPPEVKRSLLALKLLTYEPTGAILAAPTASLPEVPGGERNWDYRYAWIRDTAFCAQAYASWGKEREAHRIARWLLDRVLTDGPLHVLYRVDGAPAPDETVVELPGHEGSRPVRVGNGAIRQFQLDAYGHAIETLDVCHALDAGPILDAWPRVRELVDDVIERWREPDNGIWEIPAGPSQHVYSKVMAWFALDRALRIAREHGLEAPTEAWERARGDIRDEVLDRGVDAEGAFVGTYWSTAADAANLRIPLLGFVETQSPEAVATLEAVRRELVEGALVRRYRTPDGLPGDEGAFVACSFWLAQLQLAAGRRDEGRRTYEAALAALGSVGLFPEEIDPPSGAFLGNYPQAISHAAHLCAAHALAQAAPRREVRA